MVKYVVHVLKIVDMQNSTILSEQVLITNKAKNK
jgi:hypothetical protein